MVLRNRFGVLLCPKPNWFNYFLWMSLRVLLPWPGLLQIIYRCRLNRAPQHQEGRPPNRPSCRPKCHRNCHGRKCPPSTMPRIHWHKQVGHKQRCRAIMVLPWKPWNQLYVWTVLYCFELFCTVLYCFVLFCIFFWVEQRVGGFLSHVFPGGLCFDCS